MSTQFQRLDQTIQTSLLKRVQFRQERFLKVQAGKIDFPQEVLLIGDQPAPSAKVVPENATLHYTPFGALRHSSLYINLQLEKDHISEHRLAWVNRADVDGNALQLEILVSNQKPNWEFIIALGSAASAFLREHGLMHSFIPHPSYWKRFHSKETYPLGEMLLNLLGEPRS